MYKPSSATDGRASCFTIPDKALTGAVHNTSGGKRSSAPPSPFGKWFGAASSPISKWRAVADATNPATLVRFEQGGAIVQVVDVAANQLYSIDLRTAGAASGIALNELVSVQSVRANEWVLQTTDESVVYALERSGDVFTLKQANIERAPDASDADTRQSIYPQSASTGSIAGQSGDGVVTVHPDAFLQSLKSQDATVSVESAMRAAGATRWGLQGAWTLDSGSAIANAASSDDQVDLEVTFPQSHATKTIVLDANDANGSRTLPRITGAAAIHSGRHFVTLQESGDVRLWQLDQAAIDREVALWKQMFGVQDGDALDERLTLKVNGQDAIQRESVPKTGLDKPKYGKEDPKNEPHVGGNTWAGGTGGSDTAGLGGRGGPYRLDKGHPVHQVSQAKKDEVSAETRAKARAMAEEALAAKLQEIDMSEREWETYQTYFGRVEHESAQLRSILANLESVAQERTWLKHQSSGELDDAKLVDGVTGDRLVFKKRGVSDSPFHSMHQSKPKRLLFVMDVSGSMYRFNGQDGRLERVLETSLMIMESFAGFESKLDYCIMGHSGDSPAIPFVDFGNPPADRKERLKVLQKMVAHTQYCMSGDHTVEAIDRAVQQVVEADADDYYVFVVSDANLERYNIQPKRMGQKLVADPTVKAHAIFIASFADEAARILRDLPHGRGHVCLDTADLPRTFKKIFTSAFGN